MARYEIAHILFNCIVQICSHTGQIYSFDLTDSGSENKTWPEREQASTQDVSYLGYSSATGNFFGGDTQDIVVGRPRGADYLGQILIFTWDLKNQQNITGEQMGAYFGYSLCAVDIDGDGRDDIVVGAPMYTEDNYDGEYEMGRIYIIYQGKSVRHSPQNCRLTN